jgi:hypothetical protein
MSATMNPRDLPRRGSLRRRFLVIGALALAPIVAAMAALLLWSWLWWISDDASSQRSRGVNALWAAHTWVGDPHTDAEYRAFAELMQRNDISDVFFHAGPLEADGSVPAEKIAYADELLAAMDRYSPGLRAQAYLGQIEARDGGILDLDDASVRDGIVRTAGMFLALGFDGIHYDIEPIFPGDDSFLDLLQRTEAIARPRGAVVSVALEQMEVSGAIGFLRRITSGGMYHDPTRDFLLDVADRVDQVAIMTYDTGLPTGWLYGDHVAWQTERIVELIGDDVTVFLGVPTHEDESLRFHSWAENIDSGVRGVRRGLDSVDDARSRNVGVAIFAEWTTTQDEWDAYAEAWLRD